jgi:hypothetical protein
MLRQIMAAARPTYCHWTQAINVAQWQPGGEVCLVSPLAGARGRMKIGTRPTDDARQRGCGSRPTHRVV